MPENQNKLIIRKVGKTEIHAMVEARIQYLSELLGEKEGMDLEKLKVELITWFKRSMAESHFFALAAELDGKIVGYGGMVIKEIPGDFDRPFYLEGDILNMYTLPEARRQGIASQILIELVNEAKIRGISKIALHTSKDGEKLYRGFGFNDPVFPYLERIL
jgi:GNAT superfamily N-acetyltransferase